MDIPRVALEEGRALVLSLVSEEEEDEPGWMHVHPGHGRTRLDGLVYLDRLTSLMEEEVSAGHSQERIGSRDEHGSGWDSTQQQSYQSTKQITAHLYPHSIIAIPHLHEHGATAASGTRQAADGTMTRFQTRPLCCDETF